MKYQIDVYTYINFIPRQTDRLIIGHLLPSSIVCTNAVEVESSGERPEMKIGQNGNNDL